LPLGGKSAPCGFPCSWPFVMSPHRRKWPSVLGFLTFIALIGIGIALSIPSVARLPRAYYNGKDQFEWAGVLASGQAQNRQEAITALCEILKDKRNHKWGSIFHISLFALADGKASEALPTLVELLEELDDPVCRADVKHAIQIIEPNK